MYLKIKYFFTTTAPPLSFFSPSLHTKHSVLNTSVKVSGGGHHYLPRKTSWKLPYLMAHDATFLQKKVSGNEPASYDAKVQH